MVEGKQQYQIKFSKGLAALGYLHDDVDIITA
jgi:hypothetical protein